VSLHVRRVMEQCYAANIQNHKSQVIMVSFADQAEVRRDFDIFCQQKGIDHPVRLQLTPDDIYSPLSPVLYVINELLRRHSIPLEQVAEMLKLEQYEKGLLLCMLKNTSTIQDFMMPSDVEYVKFRMTRHIRTIIRHLLSITDGRDPLMISVTNLQYAGSSSLRFLLTLINPEQREYQFSMRSSAALKRLTATEDERAENELLDSPNCIVVLGVNPNFNDGRRSQEWLDWEDRFERVIQMVRPEDSETGLEIDENRLVWPAQSYQARRISSIQEAINRCGILLNYFCSDEVADLAQKTLQYIRLLNREDEFNDFEEKLYHYLGRAHLYNHNYEDALLSFDMMYEKAQYTNNNDNACRAYIELAYTHIFRSDFESVLHFAEMAAHLGEVSMNLRLVTIANFCLFVAYDRASIKYGYHNIVSLLSNLERHSLYKEQTYVLRNIFAQVSLDSNVTLKMSLDYCNQAVNIAQRLGIRHESAAANHCRGIVLFQMDRIQEALHAYRLSEALYSMIDVPIELTHVYNSIGFLLQGTEDYPNAHEYYLQSLRNSIKLNDYSEISVTLYNLAKLYQLSGMPKESLRTLDILQDVMSIRGTYKLPLHNIHHIILQKALVYIDLDEPSFADQMLKRSRGLMTTFPTKGSEQVVLTLLEATVSAMNKNREKALISFQQARARQNDQSLTQEENVMFYLLGMRILGAYGTFEERYRYFCEGIDYVREHQLFNSMKLLKNAWNKGNYNIYKGYSTIVTPMNELNQIIPLVKQERKVNILWQQVHEMRLVTMLHKFSMSVKTYDKLAQETLRLLASHFSINGGMIYFVDSEKGTSELIYEFNTSKDYQGFTFKKIHKFINSHLDEQDVLNLEDEDIAGTLVHRLTVYPLVDQDRVFGMMLLFKFQRKTDGENEKVDSIGFIAQQLGSQLILMIQRAQLIRVSTTDMLTGLYNRMEFHNQISTVIRRLSPSSDIALGFIDLDNFKYYNDNLGHDVGDKLLVWFAKLLNEIKVPGDIACRWGGDEFLLLMRDCSADEASERMQKVLDTLKAQNGYKKEIEEFLGKPVDNLPERYYLSCSIGVMDSSSLPRPFTESDLLTHADEALYEVKRTGKGRVLNFEKMTHEADNMIVESNR